LAEAHQRARGFLPAPRGAHSCSFLVHSLRDRSHHVTELIVLGSAAGGGFPQWNCACRQCAAARAGDARFEPRSEDSLALLSAAGGFLLNATASVARQLAQVPALWPRHGRQSPLLGVVLTNGDLDHTLGLFVLREWQSLAVYATARVRAALEQNAMLRTLQRFPEQLVWRELELGRAVELRGPQGESTGVELTPWPMDGKPPLHLPDQTHDPEDNVALSLRAERGKGALYASSTASTASLLPHLDATELLLLDGTFWSEDEPREFGAPHGARHMGHVPISGTGGSLELRSSIPQRFFTHINNTNPILDRDSAERRTVEAAGWQLARDGMRFVL
jgi:pyrroloquinoline quinone biosynthesis protein B